MSTITNEQIEMKLDHAQGLIEQHKGDVLQAAMSIITAALAHGAPLYPDEIPLLKDFSAMNPAVVGIAFRLLMKQKAIVQTGKHRRSHRDHSNGRIIWQYTLA